MFTLPEVASFIEEFESCRLPRLRWMHQAHLTAAFWYLHHHEPNDALDLIRERIKCYNEAVGTANTATGGYHETITRLFVAAIARHRRQHAGLAFEDCLLLLLGSPLANSAWPLTHYSRERLFSVAARTGWVEPDREPHEASVMFGANAAGAPGTSSPSSGN